MEQVKEFINKMMNKAREFADKMEQKAKEMFEQMDKNIDEMEDKLEDKVEEVKDKIVEELTDGECHCEHCKDCDCHKEEPAEEEWEQDKEQPPMNPEQ